MKVNAEAAEPAEPAEITFLCEFRELREFCVLPRQIVMMRPTTAPYAMCAMSMTRKVLRP